MLFSTAFEPWMLALHYSKLKTIKAHSSCCALSSRFGEWDIHCSMNTFLPYACFKQSAACLDMRRLGKQRVEVLQLLQGSFPNHPASRMWRGYEHALAVYGTYICAEWQSRGYCDTVFDKLQPYLSTGSMPPWFGAHQFHSDCRANLLRKDAVYYSRYGWLELPKKGYSWPTLDG